jgi:hypothetical protein
MLSVHLYVPYHTIPYVVGYYLYLACFIIITRAPETTVRLLSLSTIRVSGHCIDSEKVRVTSRRAFYKRVLQASAEGKREPTTLPTPKQQQQHVNGSQPKQM